MNFKVQIRILRILLTVCSCHVTYVFQRETTLYSCLNVKGLLARSRLEIWSLSDCNWTRTHNHLVRNQTLYHLAKLAKLASLAKWLSVHLRTKLLWVRIQLQSLKNTLVIENRSIYLKIWKYFCGNYFLRICTKVAKLNYANFSC